MKIKDLNIELDQAALATIHGGQEMEHGYRPIVTNSQSLYLVQDPSDLQTITYSFFGTDNGTVK